MEAQFGGGALVDTVLDCEAAGHPVSGVAMMVLLPVAVEPEESAAAVCAKAASIPTPNATPSFEYPITLP